MPDQRVYDRKVCDAIEVSVRRPQLADAVLPAQSRDAGVVDLSSRNSAACDDSSQRQPVICRFGQEHEGWRLEPCVHLVESARQRRWRCVDAGMRDNG
jgi:hypothetical protein